MKLENWKNVSLIEYNFLHNLFAVDSEGRILYIAILLRSCASTRY